MDLPHFVEVEFTKFGRAHDPAQIEAALGQARRFTDLLIFSHGWNNNVAEARELYRKFFGRAAVLLAGGHVAAPAGRTFGALGILWPSKKFTDEDLIPGGGAASAGTANNAALNRVLDELKHDPERLGDADTDPVRSAVLDRVKQLALLLDDSEDTRRKDARKEFVFQLRSLVDFTEAHADDGSDDFFTRDPLELFEELSEPVVAPLPVSAGGAAGLDGDDGGAAGLKDLLDGAKAAGRRIANFTTYYQMKQRAGVVGRAGLSDLLRTIRRAAPDARLHLIGHSFGGRVVTAAADALDRDTPAVTISLLQAAFSHNGLARKFDTKRDGFFRKLIDERRASGPILITHTKNDKAVGVAYPLASRFAREKAAAFGDENDPYGGMGRNGAQHTPEAQDRAGDLLEVRGGYTFEPGGIYNLRGDRFIKDHGDVAGDQVVYAALRLALAV